MKIACFSCKVAPKVYFFLDLLKVRHVLPLQQHFLMAILLGFWMGALPGIIYDTHRVRTRPEVNLGGWAGQPWPCGRCMRKCCWRGRTWSLKRNRLYDTLNYSAKLFFDGRFLLCSKFKFLLPTFELPSYKLRSLINSFCHIFHADLHSILRSNKNWSQF